MHSLTTLGAFVKRDWRTAVSYRLHFAFDLSGTLLGLAMFFYLGRLVDRTAALEHEALGTGYFAFAVIGIAVLQFASTGISSFANKLRGEQTTGTLEALVATPVRMTVFVLGSMAYDLLYAAAWAIVMILLAVAVFGLRIETDAAALAAALMALVLSVALFAAVGVAVAAFAIVFKQAAALISMIVPAVALFSGVYFPVSVLPEGLRLAAAASPFAWALEVLRGALLRGEVDVIHLVLLLTGVFVLLPASLVLFGRALQHGRSAGSLAQY